MNKRAIAPWLGLGSMVLIAGLGESALVSAPQSNQNAISQQGKPTAEWMSQATPEITPPADFKTNPASTPTPPLPPLEIFPSFNSQRLDQQIRLYAHYLATEGPPDVLVVGSSRALQGVDPVVLQEALSARGIHNQRVYNFSINGATARVVDLMVRRILLPNQLPKVVVWADGSRAFNNGRPDVTYNGIVSSPGYRRMGTSTGGINRPIPDIGALQALLTEAGAGESMVRANNRAGRQATLEQERSQEQTVVDLLPPLPTTDLTANGFQVVTAQFQPATYYRRFPRVSGRYDNNYFPWQLEGPQTQATVAIAQYLRSQRIPLVFVSLPLSREHLADHFRRSSEQQFRRHMQRLSTQNSFLFRDLSQRWPTEHRYFADPSHINRNGAAAVARQIAADAGTAWERWLGAE